jgi:hypothetical protein
MAPFRDWADHFGRDLTGGAALRLRTAGDGAPAGTRSSWSRCRTAFSVLRRASASRSAFGPPPGGSDAPGDRCRGSVTPTR